MADLGSILGSAGIGGAIGKAIVSLELETTKYQAELKAAQAQTVARTNRRCAASRHRSQASHQTALLGVGVAAVAVRRVLGQGRDRGQRRPPQAPEHLREQREARPTPPSEAFERQADALLLLTGVDDEAIIAGAGAPRSFELTGEQVQELTPLVVDLSAKYDIDLPAAVKAVGKATQGNTGGLLSRYGIDIDETAGKTDEFEAVLEGLGSGEGFAAERRSRPNRGGYSRLGSRRLPSNSVKHCCRFSQDLAESLGGLVPVLEAGRRRHP